MADIINKLNILNDFKKEAIVSQKDLNENLIYSSLASVSLINTIKEYYGETKTLNNNLSDSEIKSFLQISLKNFFLDNYASDYGISNNSKGYITKLVKNNNDNNTYTLIEENYPNDYKFPMVDLKMNNGIGATYEKYVDSNINDQINLFHGVRLSYPSNNYKKTIYGSNCSSKGYNMNVTLNSYNINDYGHVVANFARKVKFPDHDMLSKTFFNEYNTDTYAFTNLKNDIYVNIPYKYYTMFKITFYNEDYYDVDKIFITLLVTLPALQNGANRGSYVYTTKSDLTSSELSIDFEINSDRTMLHIQCFPPNAYSGQKVYLRRIEGFVVN